ncbi:hypothetical protein AK812_SmicGene5021 [Symbiodinium microadriaticum]|uniref:J domain-containing protein n=1 Tax=Symbiodinium microadriaticum TaxID=2951 RepID=A0A1Q9EUR6_SYMMI|nr:hypothetical protein AK812_SmicGene5021 [Symbiodinium microadriaticum]
MHAMGFWLPLLACLPLAPCLPKANTGLTRLEIEELAFMKSSLRREMDGATEPGHVDSGPQAQEKAIRRAYRNIARRFRKNIFEDQAKFEFQMRILNLAKEAMVKGEGLGGEGWGDEDDDDDEDDNETKGPGRELPGNSRASDDILKQIHGWQEFALEEGVRFDDPEEAFFVGHTQHAFRDAFAANWSHFLRQELAGLWPATSALRYQVELDGSSSPAARADALRYMVGSWFEMRICLAEAARQLARDALATIAGVLHDCGGRDPPMAGSVPESGNTAAWVDLQLKASRNLRALFAGYGSLPESCAIVADREVRTSLLELNLEALEHLASADGDGHGRVDVVQELRAAHAAAAAVKSAAMPLHCQESADLKRRSLERLWEEYQFGPLVEEAYPCDPCGLQGMAMFLEFHIGRGGELLERRAEPDRSVLRALRGLLSLQQVLARPASMSTNAIQDVDNWGPDVAFGGWRSAVSDIEEAVWKGLAFPELHTAAGHLMAELAKAGLLPDIFAAMMEHPPVVGLGGTTLPQGREPSDVQPPRDPRFQSMSIPGYNMKPVNRYEERALRMWGDEEIEENWDPVRLGLSYIDLTPACDLPLQVAMCFLSAALWLWRALELLGDNCGGDGWLDIYIFEDIWSAPEAAKRLAMQYSLKRAVLELVDYAANMAEHQLLPGARLAVQRSGYLLLRKVTARFGVAEDGPKVMAQLKRYFAAARVNPLWSPPVLPVSDAVFIDILSGRLHAAFLEKLHSFTHESDSSVLPQAVPEYTLYEAALLGGGEVNMTFARYELMGALLRDARNTWSQVESLLSDAPFHQDAAGFVSDQRPRPKWASLVAEFSAVRGLRVDAGTGTATLLLSRPSAVAPALFSLADMAAVLALEDTEPMAVMLDPPAQPGSGMAEYPHHPFQRVTASPGSGTSRLAETSLLHAAMAIQQLASGTEVAFRAPFPTRDCARGLCKALPKSLRSKLSPISHLRTEAWDVPSRLVMECPRIPYWQVPAAGNVLEVRFGEPKLEVHAGEPLRELNEEEFRKWPTSRLQAALKQIQSELVGTDPQDELPPLEKQELVDRLLRAAKRGLLVEDEEESKDPLIRFSRRLTHHLAEVGQRWPHLARIAPFCALRAAGLIIRMQLQQMRESVKEQQEGLQEASKQHADGVRTQQHQGWRGVLAEVHAGVLSQLGFVDLDHGRCFEGKPQTFGDCCSVGDFEDQCWGAGSDLSARDKDRCCGGAVLVPAVDAWLKDPAGRLPSGETSSMALIQLLAEDVSAEDVLHQQGQKLKAPGEKLARDLKSMQGAPGSSGARQ